MAAPEHVPVDRTRPVRTYESPPRRPEPWLARRPAELVAGQPRGPRFGNPGPDQGYALLLAERFVGTLVLAPGEDERDALAGAAAVAIKRASLFGRAPVVHDLTVALTIWGFLADAPPPLVALRSRLFAGVASPHHDAERREIVALVPESILRKSPDDIAVAHQANWRVLLPELPAGT